MFEHGELKCGDSPLIGFSTLLDDGVEWASGLSRNVLAAAIFKGRHEALGKQLHPQGDVACP